MRLNKVNVITIIILIFITFIGCSNGNTDDVKANDIKSDNGNTDNGSNPTVAKTLSKLGISDAKSLYISTSSTSRSVRAISSGPQKLFKITTDGYIEEVKYLDDNGNEITNTEQPVAIYPVNNDYIIVCFGIDDNNITSAYLVRNVDGAVFDMKLAGLPSQTINNFKNTKAVFTDSNNNFYYSSLIKGYNNCPNQVVKVNLLDPTKLASSIYSPSTDCVEYFDIDNKGNMIYVGRLLSEISGTRSIYRIKKANGGLFNMDTFNAIWIGPDGNMYYCDTNTSSIHKVTIDSNYNVSVEDYGTGFICSYISYKVDFSDKVYLISESGTINEVYNIAGTPRVVSLSGLTIKHVANVISSTNYYFIAGSNTSNQTFLIKINPDTDSYTNILPQNDYDVYSFIASETDGIIFNALRMSDGKKVIGKVGIDGTNLKIIDEESDATISYLERIN